jgi:hypothetical protein
MFRIVKLSLISLVAMFIVLLLISRMIPSTVRVSRAVNIQAPKKDIYPLLADTARWSEWNQLKNEHIAIQLLSADSNLIHSRWTYAGRSLDGYYRLEKIRDVTVVQWYFEIRLKWYPWEKFASITFEKQFGGGMESSLAKLQEVVTNSP